MLHLYNIMQTSDETKEKYQLWNYELILYKILQDNIMRIIWQTVRRVVDEILGVKGLSHKPHYVTLYMIVVRKESLDSFG